MISEAIEQLKRSFTDKFVTVLPQQPDLARFAGLTGQIKTVNMSGRALVEFADYHQNIGWYDIDLDHLVVVPAPNVAVAASVAKAAPPAKASAAKPAPAAVVKAPPVEKPAVVTKPPAAAGAKASDGKQSVADILAAARATDGGGAAAPAPKAAPKPAAGGARLSVAEMMAAARANDGAPAAKAPVAKSVVEVEVAKPQAAGDSPRTSRAKLTAADILAMATSSKRIEKLHAERRPMRVATSTPSRPSTTKRTNTDDATPPMTAAEILALQGKMKVKVQPVVSDPLPKAAAAKVAEAKPAAAVPAAASSSEGKAAAVSKPQAAAKPVAAAPVAASGGRPSIAEMLELCRTNAPFGTSLGGAAASPAASSEPAPAAEPTLQPVAVAEAPAPPAPVSNGAPGGRLSVAEAIAACRASDGG